MATEVGMALWLYRWLLECYMPYSTVCSGRELSVRGFSGDHQCTVHRAYVHGSPMEAFCYDIVYRWDDGAKGSLIIHPSTLKLYIMTLNGCCNHRRPTHLQLPLLATAALNTSGDCSLPQRKFLLGCLHGLKATLIAWRYIVWKAAAPLFLIHVASLSV
jgi:hypothetical protein